MPADAEFWIVQFLNGLQFSMLLFLLSVGLTVIFGLLHFINLAHGSLYALGAFIGVSVAPRFGYWSALVVAPVVVMGVGTALYLGLIRHMRHSGPMAQVLVSFGLIFVLLDIFRLTWGDIPTGLEPPAVLSGPAVFFGIHYPAYRLFIILLGLCVIGVLSLVLSRTPVGIVMRASVENDAMAACLGINVERLFFSVFCVGCALAGLAGVVAAPVLAVSPGMGADILIPALIVVVVGGLGSLNGAIAGSLIVGFTETFGSILAPQLASVLTYLMLAGVLIFRPSGLFAVRR